MFRHALQVDRRPSVPRRIAPSGAVHASAPSDPISATPPIPSAALAATSAAEPATARRIPAKRWFSTGLVSALALAVTLAFTGCVPSHNPGARALNVAMTQLGKPYIAGAAGPYGYDCSGLVQYSFARAGRLLPRVATAQYYATQHIPVSWARPGDLIFFGSPAYLHHVAIYAGGGNIVAAPHTGTVVKVERLWTSNYYVGRIN